MKTSIRNSGDITHNGLGCCSLELVEDLPYGATQTYYDYATGITKTKKLSLDDVINDIKASCYHGNSFLAIATDEQPLAKQALVKCGFKKIGRVPTTHAEKYWVNIYLKAWNRPGMKDK